MHGRYPSSYQNGSTNRVRLHALISHVDQSCSASSITTSQPTRAPAHTQTGDNEWRPPVDAQLTDVLSNFRHAVAAADLGAQLGSCAVSLSHTTHFLSFVPLFHAVHSAFAFVLLRYQLRQLSHELVNEFSILD